MTPRRRSPNRRLTERLLVLVTSEQLASLDDLADSQGASRAEVVRSLLAAGAAAVKGRQLDLFQPSQR